MHGPLEYLHERFSHYIEDRRREPREDVLTERPDIQQLLRRERDRVPNFIEETLRLESPVKGDFRLSRASSTVGGVDIPAGTTLMVLNGAANRDPKQFGEPNMFDPARPNARRHIAFGEAFTLVPVLHWPARRRGIASSVSSIAPPTSRSPGTYTARRRTATTGTSRHSFCAA